MSLYPEFQASVDQRCLELAAEVERLRAENKRMMQQDPDLFVKMEPVQTYSLTAINADELARLRRIEEAARAVLVLCDEYDADGDKVIDEPAVEALRAALEEKP